MPQASPLRKNKALLFLGAVAVKANLRVGLASGVFLAGAVPGAGEAMFYFLLIR